MKIDLGVIGGTGLYEMEDVPVVDRVALDTPFGEPSDPYVVVESRGRRLAFLARHGAGHRRVPSSINYRANIFGFKLLGVERIVSVSAVGSLKETIHPNEIVLPDQFFDATRGRKMTFFDEGLAAHVEFAHPVCGDLGATLLEKARALGHPVHDGGCYVCIEGPQFSTRAEADFHRGLGAAVVGMTNATEARLAREAEICYATLAMVTDYDCWHEGESVSVEVVVRRLHRNARMARDVILEAAPSLESERRCPCGTALRNAVITTPEAIEPAARERLRPLLGRYLK